MPDICSTRYNQHIQFIMDVIVLNYHKLHFCPRCFEWLKYPFHCNVKFCRYLSLMQRKTTNVNALVILQFPGNSCRCNYCHHFRGLLTLRKAVMSLFKSDIIVTSGKLCTKICWALGTGLQQATQYEYFNSWNTLNFDEQLGDCQDRGCQPA